MAYKVFIDTNVYLDVLMHRGADWQYAESLLLLAEQKHLTAYTSASNLLNLMYILHTEKISQSAIIRHSTSILRFSHLTNPDNTAFEMALTSSFSDLEDAVQYFTALTIPGIDYFITSNIKDFKKALTSLPVITSKLFVQFWESIKKDK
jgi:predicted nucleic acid-binding protein